MAVGRVAQPGANSSAGNGNNGGANSAAGGGAGTGSGGGNSDAAGTGNGGGNTMGNANQPPRQNGEPQKSP